MYSPSYASVSSTHSAHLQAHCASWVSDSSGQTHVQVLAGLVHGDEFSESLAHAVTLVPLLLLLQQSSSDESSFSDSISTFSSAPSFDSSSSLDSSFCSSNLKAL